MLNFALRKDCLVVEWVDNILGSEVSKFLTPADTPVLSTQWSIQQKTYCSG